ncbi:ABC transporter ATP-binding protein [Candidatus Odyssella acanthamoebae]|uniref:ABC transporter ATP-binding protein n=1 Tax=Candidatus Odyssella acanthamoebae TaxID=91604 RepID=A0A077ASR9_9PROT|nr:ABC transporter ATP-binding protein [Candidatus Paracaedibacter acanthamoebae]AIK96247.1 hypothetical protein ID47_05055 [Candidatus Paracaedibacter acanthamoebae]
MRTPNLKLEVLQFCFTKFFSVLKADRRLLVSFFLAIGVFLVALLFNVFLPLVLKFIIQSLEETSNSMQLMIAVVCGYGLMWTVAQIGEHIREIMSVGAVERTIRKLITLFYYSVLNHHNPQKKLPATGTIINKLGIFREGFNNLIWGVLFFLLPTVLEILCACFVLWYLYGWFYASILLCTIGLYGVCTYIGVSLYLKHQVDTYDKSAQVSGFLSDRLFNIETIYSLGNPDNELTALDSKLRDLENRTTRTKQVFEVVRIIQGIIIGSALTLVIYHCVNNISKGNQHISDFVLINSYILQFFTPLSSLGIILNDIYRSFAEVAGMMNLMNSTSHEERPSSNILLLATPTNIVMKDVSFSYGNNDHSLILKNVDLEFKAGWKIGIVGHSGSGKTTLGKLLSGLYHPDKGEIYLNHIPLSSYERQTLKSIVSYIPQHVQLFNDTLHANIIYANPEASSKDIQEAINGAQLKEVIKRLPDGLRTVLGEQGYSLSGGERQRIGIARAILKKSSISILDEPTSFLDPQTEEKILNYFHNQKKRMTQIIIAHRLNMVMDADWVVMLGKGEIIAQGTPHELINSCSSFRELWGLDKQGQDSMVIPSSR